MAALRGLDRNASGSRASGVHDADDIMTIVHPEPSVYGMRQSFSSLQDISLGETSFSALRSYVAIVVLNDGHSRYPHARSREMDTVDYSTEAVLFDYRTEAELFSTRSRKSRRQPLGYRRFARAADAIRFAIEELPSQLLVGTYLEVDEERFEGSEIRRLYDSADYPLARRAASLLP
jgi:hypothetical protein